MKNEILLASLDVFGKAVRVNKGVINRHVVSGVGRDGPWTALVGGHELAQHLVFVLDLGLSKLPADRSGAYLEDLVLRSSRNFIIERPS